MALTYAPNCSLLVSNTGGNVQVLPDERVGGKPRVWVERIPITLLAIADQIMVARLPYGSVPIDITIETDTSLSNAQVSFGDKNNTSRFAAAGAFTSTDARTSKLRASASGVPITTAYDNAGVNNTNYEDILLTVGVSSIAAGGTLTINVEYLDYGV